ncbi:MAG: pyrroloquinoline quinone precursor peptide PqqA [Micromonosporaceae bacterium]
MTTTHSVASRPAPAQRRRWAPPKVEQVHLGAEVTSYAGADDPFRD